MICGEFFVAGHFDITNPVLVVFLDFNGDVIAVDGLLGEGQGNAPRKRRLYKRQRSVDGGRFHFDDRIEDVRSNVAMVGVEHPNPGNVVGQF